MTYSEHPVAQLLDGIAATGRPPAREIDDLVARYSGPDLSAPKLRDELERATRTIERHRADGDAGQARTVARDTARRLVDQLDGHENPDESPPPSMAEIVDSIPRGIG